MDRHANAPLLAAIVSELRAADDAVKRELATQLRPYLASGAGDLLDVDEKADQMHLNPDTLARMARAGRIPGAFKSGRRWLFPAASTEILPVAATANLRPLAQVPESPRRLPTSKRNSVSAIRGR
jgi:hypothetical protein